MSTRSRIGIEKEDGTVESLWCHWNGSPDYTGTHLLAEYNTREKAAELVAKGDREHIDTDAGLYGEPPRHDKNAEEFWESIGSDWEEYGYLMTTDGTWHCHNDRGDEIVIPKPEPQEGKAA